MSTDHPFPAVQAVIRYAARTMRREFDAVAMLIDACQIAHEEGVDEAFLTAGATMLARAAHGYGFGPSAIPPEVAAVLDRCRELAERQRDLLASLYERAATRSGERGEIPLLLGDGAILAVLYRDLGAFVGSLWIAGIDGHTELPTATSAGVQRASSHFQVVGLGPLAREAERWMSHDWVVDRDWRVPEPVLLVTLLAARVGDALAHPNPPIWPHLALAVKGWQNRLSSTAVLGLAVRLGLEEEVHRGLATVAHLFPELHRWVPVRRLKVSRLERKLAIPLAAKKLLASSGGDGEPDEPEDPPPRP